MAAAPSLAQASTKPDLLPRSPGVVIMVIIIMMMNMIMVIMIMNMIIMIMKNLKGSSADQLSLHHVCQEENLQIVIDEDMMKMKKDSDFYHNKKMINTRNIMIMDEVTMRQANILFSRAQV